MTGVCNDAGCAARLGTRLEGFWSQATGARWANTLVSGGFFLFAGSGSGGLANGLSKLRAVQQGHDWRHGSGWGLTRRCLLDEPIVD